MQLLLRRTHVEIFEHNSRAIGLELLRIINVISPRSWKFDFRFSAAHGINLHISSNPQLTIDEFVLIADGTNPALFNANSISFVSQTLSYEGKIEIVRSNSIDMQDIKMRKSAGIHLLDYMHGPLPASYSSKEKITSYLFRETWFGSEFLGRQHGTFNCEWVIFGASMNIVPNSWVSFTDSQPQFKKEQMLDIDGQSINIYIASSSKFENGLNIAHSRLGPYPKIGSIPKPITKMLKSTPLFIEINETRLKYESNGEIGPISLVTLYSNRILELLLEVMRSPAFIEFQAQVKKELVRLAAEALKLRQENMSQRAKLYLGVKNIGYVPISENEVMVLLAKLEAFDALPLSSFRLIEYTPQAGIDALADFQFTETSKMQKLAPVELEFYFENFIRHGHPTEQVALIVCWDFQNQAIIDRLQLSKRAEWYYEYTSGEDSCPVLVLSKLENISQIKT